MPKREAPLVTEHLEGISWKVLRDYSSIVRQYIRRRHGVYALYKRDKLHYVGLASNLMGRLRHHLRDRDKGKKGKWNRFSVYLTINVRHMKELESLLLRIADPPGNKQKGKFAKSANLKRRLKADIRDFLAVHVGDLLGSRRNRTGKSRRETAISGIGIRIRKRMRLRAKYKGKVYKASLRKSGKISMNGKVFDSPSAAAKKILRRSANGWRFWKVERSPGNWVRLRELRS